MLSYKPYNVSRHKTAIVDGEVEVVSITVGQVRGSLQPIGFRESSLLPESFRTEAKYKLYTRDSNLIVNGVRSDGTLAIGDEIDTVFGTLRVLGNEDSRANIVDTRLFWVAHSKYILAGPSGG